jgi:Mce-associated membrane protein
VSEPFLDDEGVPAAPQPPAEVGVAEHPADAAAAAPLADAEAGPAASTSPTRERGPVLVIVSIVLAVAVVGIALAAASFASTLHRERNDRHSVQDVSGRFAAALLTYDYANLDVAKKRVLALSTGKFRKEYEQAFTGGLDTLFKSTQARSAGTVTDVFVGDIESGTVTTIAVVDAVATGTAGTRRMLSSYIELQLVKVHGTWKVDGVTNLNLAAAGSDTGLTTPTPQTAPTTATSAPAK